MTDARLLRLTCATADAEPVVDALRTACTVPIHMRDEVVRGLDVGDAGIAERVNGALRRTTIELTIDAADVDRLVAAVAGARRRLPVRWAVLPVLRQGRLA